MRKTVDSEPQKHQHTAQQATPSHNSAHRGTPSPSRVAPLQTTRAAERKKFMSDHRRMVTAVFGCIILLALVGLFALATKPSSSSQLPQSVAEQISGFTPYLPGSSSDSDFTLVPSSVSYASGVLIFELQNKLGVKVSVSEETVPAGYNTSQILGDNPTSTTYGKMLVQTSTSGATGNYFTDDNTWVIVNTLSLVSEGEMQQLVSSLAPVKSH